jgi:hypothetical protein
MLARSATRVKRSYLVNGMTNLCDTQNVMLAVGPAHDIARDIVVLRISYVPPRPITDIRKETS